MAVGIREMTETDVAGAATQFIKYFVDRLDANGVPVVTPAGGLACHVDAKRFLPHIASRSTRPARWPRRSTSPPASAAWSAARSPRTATRRATTCWPTWNWRAWPCRAASTPCRTSSTPSTASPGSTSTATWSAGCKFIEEPPVLRFFFGRLAPVGDWPQRLAEAFVAEFGAGC